MAIPSKAAANLHLFLPSFFLHFSSPFPPSFPLFSDLTAPFPESKKEFFLWEETWLILHTTFYNLDITFWVFLNCSFRDTHKQAGYRRQFCCISPTWTEIYLGSDSLFSFKLASSQEPLSKFCGYYSSDRWSAGS